MRGMEYDELIQGALSPLPCPVSKAPAGGSHETYVTFNEVLESYTRHSSNAPRRILHSIQVHAFSKRDDGTCYTIIRKAIGLLRAAGVRVYSCGPDLYEDNTGYHHITATCEWAQPMTD